MLRAGVEGISPAMVALQLSSVVSDIGVDAIKLGMLFSAPVITALHESIVALYPSPSARPPLVLDPVCVSTSGHSLLDPSAVTSLIALLLPLCTVLTPNVPEAILLSSWKGQLASIDDMRACARQLGELGARWVYLKGGHVPFSRPDGSKVVVDLLWGTEGGVEVVEERPWIDCRNTHGTGCSLSSAIAANLAKGLSGDSLPRWENMIKR